MSQKLLNGHVHRCFRVYRREETKRLGLLLLTGTTLLEVITPTTPLLHCMTTSLAGLPTSSTAPREVLATTGMAHQEADMFDEILTEVKEAGYTIKEIVTDKDSSMNAIYCKHFPEGTITYCSNHNAKTMHKDLQKVKALKCQVNTKCMHSSCCSNILTL